MAATAVSTDSLVTTTLLASSPETNSQPFGTIRQAWTEPTLASGTFSSVGQILTSLSDEYPSEDLEQQFNYSVNNDDGSKLLPALGLDDQQHDYKLNEKNSFAQQQSDHQHRRDNLTSKLLDNIINPVSEALHGSDFLVSNSDSDNAQTSSKGFDLSISDVLFVNDKNHTEPSASKPFPAASAAVELELSTILPSSQSSLFSILPPITAITSPSSSVTLSATATPVTTTALNHIGLNGTDPYAFTTEARYFSLPIVILVSSLKSEFTSFYH